MFNLNNNWERYDELMQLSQNWSFKRQLPNLYMIPTPAYIIGMGATSKVVLKS